MTEGGVFKYCWQEIGCRPSGGNVRYSAQRTPCRLSPTQPPGGRLPTIHRQNFGRTKPARPRHFGKRAKFNDYS